MIRVHLLIRVFFTIPEKIPDNSFFKKDADFSEHSLSPSITCLLVIDHGLLTLSAFCFTKASQPV